jgi:hypothetical protein
MKKAIWLLVCCVACIALVSCSQDEGSGETSAQKETAEVTEAAEEVAEEVALAGKWEITAWYADEIDQMKMWQVESVTVAFHADGSIESQLVYSDGGKQTSKGTWTRDSNALEVVVKGGGEEEGDHPFERTREFTIDELNTAWLAIHASIGPADKPIIVSYKAKRMP